MRLAGLNKFRIGNTQVGSGNATNADLLLNKTASADAGDLVGSMPNNGSVGTINLTTEGAEYAIPPGYHNGLGKVKAVISGILASVIKAGTTVGGILGTFTSDATATAGQILSGITAYVNGNIVTGTMPNRGIEATINAMSGDFGQVEFILPDGFYGNSNGDIVYITVLDPNGKFNPENIRAGITMFNAFPGTFTADATATADKIRSGYTAGVNGNMITGTYGNNIQPGDNTMAVINPGNLWNYENYTVTYSYTVYASGTIRTYFGLRSGTGGAAAYGKIYKNGIPVGTERVATSTTTTANFAEDFSVEYGDVFQLAVKGAILDDGEGGTYINQAQIMTFAIRSNKANNQIVV